MRTQRTFWSRFTTFRDFHVNQENSPCMVRRRTASMSEENVFRFLKLPAGATETVAMADESLFCVGVMDGAATGDRWSVNLFAPQDASIINCI